MGVSFTKSGIVTADVFYEADAMNDVNIIDATSYTPTTGTNRCINPYTWFYPEDTVAGDIFRIFVTVQYSGFDTSNTSGTFMLRWQGANFTDSTTSVWQGTNGICAALNAKQGLKDLVLSSSSGIYTYETTYSIPQTFMDTYIGSRIGIRSDYSNGVGNITVSNCMIVPEKYSVTNTPPLVKMRVGENYIATYNYVEW